ncbi:MAG: DnaJ subfamily C member 7 [Microgenomates group bacterium Gr01-1014_5]|nr:MAG: DnaJ subfamily C member 7 [Microgenomates group bacterium Gr01-1014_5]
MESPRLNLTSPKGQEMALTTFSNILETLSTELLGNKNEVASSFRHRQLTPLGVELSQALGRIELLEEQVEKFRRDLVSRDKLIVYLRGLYEQATRESDLLHTELGKTQARLKETEVNLSTQRSENANLRVEVGSLRARNAELSSTRASTQTPHEYYTLLGIDPKALKDLSEEDIQRVLLSMYRAFSLIYHPDKGGDSRKMKLINTAYEALKDPLKRPRF